MSQRIPQISHVTEFTVQYTDKIRQKLKTWHDGKLVHYSLNNRLILTTDEGIRIGSTFVTNTQTIANIYNKEFHGTEMKLFGGWLVQIEDVYCEYERDISSTQTVSSVVKKPVTTNLVRAATDGPNRRPVGLRRRILSKAGGSFKPPRMTKPAESALAVVADKVELAVAKNVDAPVCVTPSHESNKSEGFKRASLFVESQESEDTRSQESPTRVVHNEKTPERVKPPKVTSPYFDRTKRSPLRKSSNSPVEEEAMSQSNLTTVQPSRIGRRRKVTSVRVPPPKTIPTPIFVDTPANLTRTTNTETIAQETSIFGGSIEEGAIGDQVTPASLPSVADDTSARSIKRAALPPCDKSTVSKLRESLRDQSWVISSTQPVANDPYNISQQIIKQPEELGKFKKYTH